MKQKLYTQGIRIFLTPEMFEMVKKESDNRGWSTSEMVRKCISYFFEVLEDAKQRELEEQQRKELESQKALEMNDKEEENND